MVLLDSLFDVLCDHAAVVNDNPESLQKDVEVVQKEVGPWTKVQGFTDFQQLFFALHMARAKKRPFSVAYIKSDVQEEGALVLKKAAPNIKTVKYSDTQNLATLMPAMR